LLIGCGVGPEYEYRFDFDDDLQGTNEDIIAQAAARRTILADEQVRAAADGPAPEEDPDEYLATDDDGSDGDSDAARGSVIVAEECQPGGDHSPVPDFDE
jgi:hypothetical protein